MLETGKTCIQCGLRQLKKFFKKDYSLCTFCADKNHKEHCRQQAIFQLRQKRKDQTILKCSCGTLFEKKYHTVKRGDLCPLCQSWKSGKGIESGKEQGVQMTPTIEEKLMKAKNHVIQKKKLENTKQHIEQETEKKLMSTKGDTMTKIEVNNSEKSLLPEKEETQPLVCTPYSIELNQEIETSLKHLNNSSTHLLKYAEKLTRSMMCSEQREVIMEATTGNIRDAVGCLEELRNTMKTKLDFLRFAKSFEKENKK